MAQLWTFPERKFHVYPQGEGSSPIIVTFEVADARAEAYLRGDPDVVQSINRRVEKLVRKRHKVACDHRIRIKLLPKRRAILI